MKKMAIQKNSDGRPCGWGVAPTEKEAMEEAERQYAKHSCYPGETKGELEVKDIPDETIGVLVPDEPTDPAKVPSKCPECGASAKATVETMTGYALLSEDGTRFAGETDVNWDSQVPVTKGVPTGKTRFVCMNWHEYDSAGGPYAEERAAELAATPCPIVVLFPE